MERVWAGHYHHLPVGTESSQKEVAVEKAELRAVLFGERKKKVSEKLSKTFRSLDSLGLGQ